MNNILLELDCAKDILGTYQKVKDNTHSVNTIPVRSSIQQKCRALEQELNELKDQYKLLQRELIKKHNNMSQLQQDFEHAICQINKTDI